MRQFRVGIFWFAIIVAIFASVVLVLNYATKRKEGGKKSQLSHSCHISLCSNTMPYSFQGKKHHFFLLNIFNFLCSSSTGLFFFVSLCTKITDPQPAEGNKTANLTQPNNDLKL